MVSRPLQLDSNLPSEVHSWQRLKPPSGRARRLHHGPFVTEPFYDFRNEENARRMRAAIAKVRGQLGREYDLIIGGKRVKTADKIKSLNPAQPSQIVGIHQKAGKEHVEPAMQAALKAFESWSRTSVEERASLVFRVGDLCASASWNSWPGWSSKSARTGPRPTPTSPRPSTSASSTRAKPCASRKRKRPSNCPASTTRCTTFRSA